MRNMDAYHLKKLLDQLKEAQPPTDRALRVQQEYILAVSIGRELLKASCSLDDIAVVLSKLKKQFQSEINQGDTEYREEFEGYVAALENARMALRGKKEIPERPETRDERFVCGYCEQHAAYRQGYCAGCGQRFLWDGVRDFSEADV